MFFKLFWHENKPVWGQEVHIFYKNYKSQVLSPGFLVVVYLLCLRCRLVVVGSFPLKITSRYSGADLAIVFWLVKSNNSFLWWHMSRGSGGIYPGTIFEIWSRKRHFLHFEGTYEQNAKVLNHIFLKLISLILTNISVQMQLIRSSFWVLL